jgi:hypothetical protein
MDRTFRRVLITALVAGGLVVVGASSAYAAGEGLLDPVTQGATDTAEGAGFAGGALDAVVDDAPPAGKGVDSTAGGSFEVVLPPGAQDGNPGQDMTGVPGTEGVVGSLVRDVAGVVDGPLGRDGLVDRLLEGVLPTDIAVRGQDEPGPDEPGAGDPGTDGPGTGPGADGPGADAPGTDRPGAGRPGTSGPGTRNPGGKALGVATPGGPGHGTAGYGTAGYDTHGYDTSGLSAPDSDDPADAEAPPGGPDADRDLPAGGIDISWGDKATVVPTAIDGTILAGGLSDGLVGTLTGLDGRAAPVVVPGEALAQTGPLITGQLALVSLLLGLGIAALRMRRRRLVVRPRSDG